MDVAVVSNVVYPFVKGGAEKRVHEIGTRLVDRGHEITIYGRHFWDGPPEVEYEGMTLRAVSPARELYVDGRRSIVEAIEFGTDLVVPLRRHIDEHDLVVASVFPYFHVVLSKLSTLFRRTPLVVTWHEVWGEYWDEYLGTLGPCGKFVERVVAGVPQIPVAVSNVTASRLARIGPARDRIEVVPNGLDVAQVQSTPPADDGFDVLFAGRLIADKNVDLALDAFDRVATRHDATFGILGEGPEYGALREQADGLRAADRVHFLGFLDEYSDVLAHMRSADVFLSPSTREGFGITVAEAMAADCTVITARHSHNAANEVIGNAGISVAPDEAALATALDRALEGDRPPDDPVDRARQYDWSRIADRAETVYERVVDRKSSL